MIIDNISRADTAQCSRVTGNARFETVRRTSHSLFVETGLPRRLEADPNGFLLGAFLPAWMVGEKRIRVAGAICPLLAANLSIAARTQRSWFKPLPEPPVIECDYEYRPPATKSAAFFSGGVDSLAMVWGLVKRRPPGHPDRPSAALVADYQDLGGLSREETDSRFAKGVAVARALCGGIGLEVVPIRSNFCVLNGTMSFWMQLYHGAFFAAMAHFLGREFRLAHLASSFPASHLEPWGSHPQLDPFYSSQHVRISHEGIELSRLQKVETLLDWPAALDLMLVCTSRTSRGANCGACEKCVRTRLHLQVSGALANAGAFPPGEVSADQIRSVKLASEYARLCYEDALPALGRLGRDDLVTACRHVIGEFVRARKAGAARPVILGAKRDGAGPGHP